jgi:hypothetical protein
MANKTRLPPQRYETVIILAFWQQVMGFLQVVEALADRKVVAEAPMGSRDPEE